MRIAAIIATLSFALASPAQAVFVGFDSGANDTPVGANPLISDDFDFNVPLCDLSADVGLGGLAAGGGDVDMYSVLLPNGCILTAITTPIGVFGSSPDTMLGLIDSFGLANVDDDAGDDWDSAGGLITRGSAVRYQNTSGGPMTVYLAVTGYYDPNFDGIDDDFGSPHTEAGPYLLTVSVVPEPTTIGLLLGGLVLVAARRRK